MPRHHSWRVRLSTFRAPALYHLQVFINSAGSVCHREQRFTVENKSQYLRSRIRSAGGSRPCVGVGMYGDSIVAGRWRGSGLRRSRRWDSDAKANRPCPSRDRYVLLAVKFISHWWSHPSMQTSLDLKEFLSFIGAISHQAAIGNYVKDKIPQRCDGAAGAASTVGRDPSLRLGEIGRAHV